jgi:hypothetical protein
MPIQMTLGLRPRSTADQQVYFHRESDRRRLRAMLAGAAAAGVLVTLMLGLVGLRMQQLRQLAGASVHAGSVSSTGPERTAAAAAPGREGTR